ncbi:MAG: glycoside hydrolase family 97 C-terminal domain-containing protein, partial [Muribaculaceae bacterium]
TSDLFQIATAVLFQNPVQNFALTPNNLTDAPALCIDFMKNVPTHWDEIRFIDGYPGRYVVLARRSGNVWYVAGVNASAEPLRLKLDLSALEVTDATLYYDAYASKTVLKRLAKGELSTADDFVINARPIKAAASVDVEILPNSGLVIVGR